ncbi:MAG TPA: alpha/beta hydrolase-fold protein [Bacteroidales bacterium]|nr:alpha/beta hydrolase-fold protein [Bacteroidales bacterium]
MKNIRPIFLLILLLPTLVFGQSKAAQPILRYGRIDRHEMFRSSYVEARNIDVWLPENFDLHTKYPVIYFHDGQMLFDSTTTWNKQEWQLDESAGSLIASNKIRSFIVVAIWNTSLRHSEYFPQKPFETLTESYKEKLLTDNSTDEYFNLFHGMIRSDDYLKFIVTELKPFIDHNYPTLTDQQNTFIAGSSMGGLISMYAICEYPDVFGAAACLSTHWPGLFSLENNPLPQSFVDYLDKNIPPPSTHRWYFDHGTETLDALYPVLQQQIDSVFRSKGYGENHYVSFAFEGEDHSEKAWSKRLQTPLLFLLSTPKN